MARALTEEHDRLIQQQDYLNQMPDADIDLLITEDESIMNALRNCFRTLELERSLGRGGLSLEVAMAVVVQNHVIALRDAEINWY